MREDSFSHVVDVADELFFEHGVRAVTMERVREVSGVPLRQLYRMFRSKDELLTACLKQRDRTARGALHAYAGRYADPGDNVLAIFDFLDDWFRQPGFHGCVFAGAFGEVGGAAPEVVEVVQHHKQQLLELFTDLAKQTDVVDPDEVGKQLAVLFDGAMAIATFTGNTEAARHARQAAQAVLAAAR
ncbi:TetR/AcrR family transcriptional regulator [Streptomyces diacarni]|uniref:TetR/AcrR family transcriptional regulator n=1 Tax=Streptomyces diacarni TaxID=2800381 RepID=UPI0033F94CDD